MDTSPHSEHFCDANGVKLQYLDWGGEGDAIVFLSGYGATAHVFDQLAIMKQAPMPNPQPSVGSPYWQVLQWSTSYTPDYTPVKRPVLAFYALQDDRRCLRMHRTTCG